MIVQKYGGSSVANAERIMNVATRIKKRVDDGEKMIVVVSAMGKTTNDLISIAKSLTPSLMRGSLRCFLRQENRFRRRFFL